MFKFTGFRNLDFGKKLTFGFGIIILFMGGYATYNLLSLYRINENNAELVEFSHQIENSKDRFIDHLQWAQQLTVEMFDQDRNQITVELDPHACAFGRWFQGADRAQLEERIPELSEIFDQIDEPHLRLHESAATIDEMIATGADPEDIQQVYYGTTVQELNRIGLLLNDLENILLEEIEDLEEASTEVSIRVASVTLVLGIVILLFSVGVAFAITHFTVRGLRRGIAMAESIADGDLTADIKLGQTDEVGRLAAALQRMKERLEDIIGFLRKEASSFDNVSEELSKSAMSLSESANEQASALEEISSTMEEMNASIEQNSNHADKTEGISAMATKGIEDVNQKSERAFAANELIAEHINVINDIAFQTNILALNASVEAARAGEHGKGFAVVAGEVRKLADKSKEAADEIVRTVNDGLGITRESMEKLKAIMPEVKNTSSLLQEISAAGKEQKHGSVQVNTALQELNSITQTSASSSEELSSTAQEMESRATQLLEIISYFKTDGNLDSEDLQDMGVSCSISDNIEEQEKESRSDEDIEEGYEKI
ncbi:methyl-accepting chemotaxis protein [Marinilabiliaceae bacterium ANBcel2]|nr:methyl-accepting chemotaxis protein [Marinilabiliaceae bacterium ANBcel2]